MIKKKNPESVHRGEISQQNKGYLDTLTGHIIFNGEKLKAFPLRNKRNKTRVPTLITLIQYSFGSSNHGNQRREKKKESKQEKKKNSHCLQMT